jgi:hypothetical protein
MTSIGPALRATCVATAALSTALSVACASKRPGRVTEETSAPRAVDATADNAALVNQLKRVLVVTLAIDGSTVKLVDAHVSYVPHRSAASTMGERLRVTGVRGGEPVVAIDVPDPQLNIQEGGGLVRVKRRQVVAEASTNAPSRVPPVLVSTHPWRPPRFPGLRIPAVRG